MPWAENILVTVSGLSREERNAVKDTLEGAGGRYTPSLSRRCTHLVVSHDAEAASSRKLALALHNRAKWRTHIVTSAWITACSGGGMRLPEQDFAAPVLQELAPDHGLGGQEYSSHAARPKNSAYQQTALHSCSSTPCAANTGAAAPQAPSGSPPLAKSRLRRQHSRRLSRFAPCPGAGAQENVTLLQHQRQQPTSGNSEIAATKRGGDQPAAVDACLTVKASGPAFARRPGMAGRIAHPAQQPLQQLPAGSSLHQHPDSAPCRVHTHAPPASAMVAASGPSVGAPQQVQPQLRDPLWLPNQQQQLCLQPVHQPVCSHHQPMSRAASITAVDGSRNNTYGGGLAGAQLAQAVEAPAKSVHLAGGVLEGRAGACAQGVPTGACGATAKTGSVSLSGSVGWATGARTDGLAAKLAALCHSKNSLASRSTHHSIPTERDAPAAPELKHLQAQSSTPGSNGALKARLATMTVHQSAHNHSCVTVSRHPAGDRRSGAEKSATLTFDRQVSRNTEDLARSDARDQSAVISSSGRPVATSGAEGGASSSSCLRGGSTAGTDARSGTGPRSRAIQRKHAEGEKVSVPDKQDGPQQKYAAEQNLHADMPSLERGTWQQHEQEVEIRRGVFHGMRAVLDSSLDPSAASRVREAIVAGAGECATGGFLGGSASHVVCSPTAASKWLAMGVHVVSAAWVLQSAKSGRQERCLLLSADALRGLPLAFPSAQETQHSTDASADAAARSASTCAKGAHAWHSLLDQADQRASAMSHHYQTPAALLEDIVWAVTDPPEKARLDNTSASDTEGPEEGHADIVPDSEDEQELPEQQDKMCAGDWDHAVFSAAAITVLFPADAAGALCHVSRTLHCNAPGPSRRHLLAFVHAFYQERLTAAEISEALQGGLRCSSEVRGTLLAGRGVRRGDLLGSRRNFEGLSRVSRCRNATVYELNLSC